MIAAARKGSIPISFCARLARADKRIHLDNRADICRFGQLVYPGIELFIETQACRTGDLGIGGTRHIAHGIAKGIAGRRVHDMDGKSQRDTDSNGQRGKYIAKWKAAKLSGQQPAPDDSVFRHAARD